MSTQILRMVSAGTKALSTTAIFCTLLALEIVYELLLRHIEITDCLWLAPLNAGLYTLVFITLFRFDLIRLSIGYLALPYLLFFPGWLNAPIAIAMVLIFSYCLCQTLKQNTSIKNTQLSVGEFAAFIMILIWVNLSGAGGYGYQTLDYTIHNGRLLDLINYSWPVHYATDKNFIYYIGYFLPSAMIGKLFGYSAGMRSMFVWTLIGVILATRWLSNLSGWKISIFLVLAFALFGPLDILGDIYLYAKNKNTTTDIAPDGLWNFLNGSTDNIDFWSSINADFFIGNFLSNTFGLYWSPQQVVSGWICAGTLTHLFIKEKTKQFIFVFSLISLWAPLVMIAMSPMVFGVALLSVKKDWRGIITPENIIGGGSITLLMLIFYSAGSVTKNSSYWMFESRNYDEILLLLLLAWGVYLGNLCTLLKTLEQRLKIWLGLLTIAFIILPLRTYGEYNDLLCRGSAPLMFLLLTFFLSNIKIQWHAKRRVFVVVSGILFSIGTISAALQTKIAILDYGKNQAVASVISYPNAYPNLGGDDNFFQKYLARKDR